MRCGSYPPLKNNFNHARLAQVNNPHLVKFFVIYSLPLFFERQNQCKSGRSANKNIFIQKSPFSHLRFFSSLPRAPSLLLARTEPRLPPIPLDRLTEPTLQRRCRKKNVQIFVTLATRVFKLSLYELMKCSRLYGGPRTILRATPSTPKVTQ